MTLSEVFNTKNYVKIQKNNWIEIYKTINMLNLIGKPIEILLYYQNKVKSETIVGISPITSNKRVAVVLENFQCIPNVTLTDKDNDNFDDSGTLSFLTDDHHNNLMNCLRNVEMLDKPVNVFYKQNNTNASDKNSDDSYFSITYHELDGHYQQQFLACAKSCTKSFVYVIVNANTPNELVKYLNGFVSAVFIRQL